MIIKLDREKPRRGISCEMKFKKNGHVNITIINGSHSVDDELSSCSVDLVATMEFKNGKRTEIQVTGDTDSFSFDIPLSYTCPHCDMRFLTEDDLENHRCRDITEEMID